MKIVVALDSFKDCMDARRACNAVEGGLRSVLPDADVVTLPLADGGEGTLDVLSGYIPMKKHKLIVKDPIGRDVESFYCESREGRAYIEFARGAGLEMLAQGERNVMRASSYGVGRMIRDALDKGIRSIIITLGGSATNDMFLGGLQALGLKVYDRDGNLMEHPVSAGDLCKIGGFDIEELNRRMSGVEMTYLYDAEIPFCEEGGAVRLYALQKGCQKKELPLLDDSMKRMEEIVERTTGFSPATAPGAGAAGGSGGGLYGFLNGACLVRGLRGIEYIMEVTKLNERLEDADMVITGEGHADAQTSQGKVAAGVLELAKERGIPCLLIAGKISEAPLLRKMGYEDIIDINAGEPADVNPLEPAIATPRITKAIAKAIATHFFK